MDKKLAKKFASFLVRLPDARLKELTKTHDLIKQWHTARNLNKYTANCFEARFSGQDDPIASWKGQGKVKLLLWDLTWREVERYEILWGTVQLTFSDIKSLSEELLLEIPFCSAFDLFLEITSSKQNLVFAKHLEPCYKYSIDEQQRLYKLTRNKVWSEKKLSLKEKEELNRLTQPDKGKLLWLELVWALCEYKNFSEPSSLVASKYREFRKKEAETYDLISKIFDDSRKGKLSKENPEEKLKSETWIEGASTSTLTSTTSAEEKLKSETWIEGKCYVGKRYGGGYG